MSNALIQQLLHAEEEAEQIIQNARDSRNRKLQEASASAEAELREFREKEERRFKEEENRKLSSTEDSLDFLKKSQLEVAQVMDECRDNFDKLVDFMVAGAIEKVDHTVPETVIRALKNNQY